MELLNVLHFHLILNKTYLKSPLLINMVLGIRKYMSICCSSNVAFGEDVPFLK